jgi:excisionase family DNA binding protein
MELTGWMTPAEAAAYTRRHPVTIRRAAIAGQLQTAQARGRRGHRRHRREWLDAWLLGEPAPVLRSAG